MRPSQWPNPDNLEGLIGDYLRAPGPNAALALADQLLRAELLEELRPPPHSVEEGTSLSVGSESAEARSLSPSTPGLPESPSGQLPSRGLPLEPCYNSEQYAEERPRASHPAGRVQEAGEGDLPRSEGRGREGQADEVESEEGYTDLGLGNHGIISLWDMLKRYAESFYQVGALIGTFRQLLEKKTDPPLDKETDDKMAAEMAGMSLSTLEERLREIDLVYSLKAVSRLKSALEPDPVLGTITKQKVKDAFKEIDRYIRDELEERVLFFVSPERAIHYNDFRGGWQGVLDRFDVAVDVEEAERCYALDRFTATVFHLMRVAEVGVQQLGKHLTLPATVLAASWGEILREVQKEIEKMPHDTIEKKEAQRKLSEIADALFHVNLAWRIPADHPRTPGTVYTEDQASEALGRVKSLMRHLAFTI